MPVFEKEFVREDGKTVQVFRVTDEEKEFNARQAAYDSEMVVCFENRRIAYESKGWFTEFDIIDDAARRGWDVVNAERLAIKQQFPKPIMD